MKTYKLFLILSICLFSVCCRRKHIKIDPNAIRYEKSIIVDGLSRTYTVNLPPKYDESKNYPLIIALHGGGGSAEQCEFAYGLTEKANSENFVIVYADGVQSDGILKARTWNAGTCCEYAVEKNIDDVHFISLMIDELIKDFKINPKRVFITGMSNGAMMSYRLACEIPNKIAAIAAVSGPLSVTKTCNSTKPIPILHFHSVLDENVPVNGGTGIRGNSFPAVLTGLNTWSKLNECKTLAKVIKDDNKYKLTEWFDCKNNAVISYYLTKDGGHSWPGSDKTRILGDNPSTFINANDIIFEFFKQY